MSIRTCRLVRSWQASGSLPWGPTSRMKVTVNPGRRLFLLQLQATFGTIGMLWPWYKDEFDDAKRTIGNAKTISDVHRVLGPPDEITPREQLGPSTFDFVALHTYRNRWESLEIRFFELRDGEYNVLYGSKGPCKEREPRGGIWGLFKTIIALLPRGQSEFDRVIRKVRNAKTISDVHRLLGPPDEITPREQLGPSTFDFVALHTYRNRWGSLEMWFFELSDGGCYVLYGPKTVRVQAISFS